MTVKQLRDALILVAERYGDYDVVVWLPGSRVHIEKFMGLMGQPGDERSILLEGSRKDKD